MSIARTTIAVAVLAMFCGAGSGAARPNSHAALECGLCHVDTPRFGVDTLETVKFWRAEGDEPQLCERCHDPEENLHPLGVTVDSRRLEMQLSNIIPLGKSEAVRDQVVCTSCHYLHAEDADHALLRGFPGSGMVDLFANRREFCRECHGNGLATHSPHTGDKRSCAFCHSVVPQPGRPAMVTPSDRQFCRFCHGSTSEEHYAGINPDRESKDCTDCHGAHLGPERPALLKAGYFDPIRDAVTLNPHRKRTTCFVCHADGKPGPLPVAATVALCQRCHDSGKITGMSHPMTEVPEGYVIPQGWPLTGGVMTCLTCHLAGHAPGSVSGANEPAGVRYLLRGDEGGTRIAVCFRCHAGDQWAGRSPHQEIVQKQTGCSLCHAADPEEGDTETFVAGINLLCLRCHDDIDHPAGIRHTVMLKAGREVPGSMPLETGRRITCATCHDPHLDAKAGYRLRGAEEPAAFCDRCHKI